MANLQILDAQLVQNYISGDEKALAKLIARHQSKIYGFIYSKIRDKEASEDLFQDVFVKVIKTLKSDGYTEQGKFISWVMQITHNMIMDYFRITNQMPKNRDTVEFSVFSMMQTDCLSVEDTIINEDIANDLKYLIEKLPENQKIVLKMRIYDNLSFKEIAANTGASINTVLGNMRYAVKRMKKLIKKHEIVITDYNIL
jgi:RNA polymerase sigma-70 factor, ECF subfamily